MKINKNSIVNNETIKILIIEDELLIREKMAGLLRKYKKAKLDFEFASDFKESKRKLKNNHYDLIFVDLILDGESKGFELVKMAKKAQNAYVLILSSHDDEDYILKGYESGCDGYLSKPLEYEDLHGEILNYYKYKKAPLIDKFISNYYPTEDKQTLLELKKIKQNYSSTLPVLITGRTGVGKTFIAKLFHELSPLSNNFVEINCTALTDGLLESELFGHVKGSFSGAIRSKQGLLKNANNGTLFLDEIGDLSLDNQAKLLKAIEEKKFYPVGSEEPVESDFRLICATNKNLIRLVSEGKFREDFYHRIAQVKIDIPALAKRKDDVPIWIDFLVSKKKRKKIITPEAFQVLYRAKWPGNIRQMNQTISSIYNLDKKKITPEDLPLDQINSRVQTDTDELLLLTNEQIEYINEHGSRNFINSIEFDVFRYSMSKFPKKITDAINFFGKARDTFYKYKKRYDLEVANYELH